MTPLIGTVASDKYDLNLTYRTKKGQTMILVNHNNDIWLIERHELIEYLEERIDRYYDDEMNALDFAEIGENLGQITVNITDFDDIERLRSTLESLKPASKEFICENCGETESMEHDNFLGLCEKCFNEVEI